MSKNKAYRSNKPRLASDSTLVNTKTLPKPKKWYVLMVKFVILFGIAVTTVVITDKRGLFAPDQSNNHTQRKWDAFYPFTDKDTVDIILVGNSHCYAGVNPKNLSAALGVNCFVLASPGTTIMDSYYCLEEALTRTHPKIVIIETYGISNTVNHNLDKGALSDQFKSFNARKNRYLKFSSTPELFSVERYMPAWSSTIRNHEFIFRDTAQLHKNIELNKHPQKKKKELYLGRFVAFTAGINDSIMHLYDSIGAPVDGAARTINKENEKYVHKIIDLCKKNDVIPVFVTIPMYYQHVKNYEQWRNTVANLIEPTGCYWLDLQSPYDTVAFNRDCFESTYDKNQHMTYLGSVTCAYKIAQYLHSLPIELPKRYETQHWNDLFYGEEGYFENYPARPNDTTNILICKDLTKNSITIKDAMLQKGEGNSRLLVKVSDDKASGRTLDTRLRLTARCRFQGHEIVTFFDLFYTKPYDPIGHSLYSISLLKGVEVLEILDAQWQS